MTMLPSLVAFRGSLSVFHILDIIQLIHSSQKTGWLRIFTQPDAELGEVAFNQGTIVAARGPASTDEEAVEQLLQVEEGSFEFRPSLNPLYVRMRTDTHRMLMRCLERLEEKGRSWARLPA